MLGQRIAALLADKGYDADAIRANAGFEAVNPGKSDRRVSIAHDRANYRWCNLVERLFSKLQHWRRIAIGCHKTKEYTSASSPSHQARQNCDYLYFRYRQR